MADRRIRISKEKADLVRDLINNEGGKGPFRLQVDVLAFAASLGASKNKWEKLEDATKEPIRRDVFDRQGYDTLFDLLAVYKMKDANVLANTEDMEDMRATIFEEYANWGLGYLRQELKGAVDYLDVIMLIIADQRMSLAGEVKGEFDLSTFLD